jgi:phospholipase/carboxylesterase
MRYTQTATELDVTLEPAKPAVATVILLHGLGADGQDFVPIVPELGLPDSMPVRFVFPHAPTRPITISGGYVMRAWYDITAFTPEGRADTKGLAEASRRVAQYIKHEAERGVPARRVLLAGFSQGGATALHVALRYPERLAGLIALSCYLPFHTRLGAEKSAANADLPILLCHGTRDPVVHVGMGLEARDELKAQGYAVEWHEYPIQHEVNATEIADIARWLKRQVSESVSVSDPL